MKPGMHHKQTPRQKPKPANQQSTNSSRHLTPRRTDIRQEALRTRVLRALEEIFGRGAFQHLSLVHEQDAVGHLAGEIALEVPAATANLRADASAAAHGDFRAGLAVSFPEP